MSPIKFKIVRYALLAYLLLTIWQVLDKREDFPLSSFPMFSQTRGFPGRASRTVLVGVNEHGEVPLESKAVSALMSAVRLQKIFQALQKKSEAEQAEFMRRIGSVLHQPGDEANQYFSVRFYTETWKTQLELKGMDRPDRELEFAGYIPPPGLLARLAEEAKSGEPRAPVRTVAAGDWVGELDASHCDNGCEVAADGLAAGGTALKLAPGGSLRITLPGGGGALFVRMRTGAPSGDDRLTVELDGKRPKDAKEGIGNYKHQLPFDAWVWASLEPGYPALRPKVRRGDPGVLVLRAERAPIEVDQIWLSRERRELPIWNDRLAPTPQGAGT